MKGGSRTLPNGNVFYGEWDENGNCRHGTMIYRNGEVYEGPWMNYLREGSGILTNANGTTFTGFWQNDEPLQMIPYDEENDDYEPDENDNDDYNGFIPPTSPPPPAATREEVRVVGTRFPFSKKSVSNLPSKVIDLENDEWGLSLSGIDGNHKDEPIVFLAGKELFVYAKKRLLNELADNTSVVYESNPEGKGVKLDVQYFNLRKLFHTLTGDIVPVKYMKNILISGKQNKKTAVRKRYHSVTDQINRIANSNIDFTTKKQHIQTLLKDNKLPPTIYQFLPVMIDKEIDGVKIKDAKGKIVKESKTVDRLWSKACADGVPGSYVSGLHGQDMGGMRWTIHTIVEVVANVKDLRRKTVKKARSKKRTMSAKSAKSAKSRTRSARSAPN